MVEMLVPFFIYCVIMLCWMWNTKKLYKRDYITFGISSILTPVIASYTYRYVAITLLGNEILYMVLVCLVTHIAINNIRRSVRATNKNNKNGRSYHNESLFYFLNSWNGLVLGVILFFVGIYLITLKLNDLSTILLIFANLLTIPSSIYLAKKRIYKIDRMDMGYDINCWSCRLIGALTGFVGFLVFVFGTSLSLFSLWLLPSVLLLALELIAIGGFCEYRSFRRQGIFVFHGRMK